MKNKRLLVMLGLFFLLFPYHRSQGFAWGKTWLGRDLERQIKDASLNLGPFSVRTVFMLTNAGYDSNVYYGATPAPVEDLTFTVSAAFNVYLPVKKKLIFSIYKYPQYVYFRETERERGLGTTVSLGRFI